MENFEMILDGYYSTLYWRAFFYGMMIPTLIYLVFNYITYRMLSRHFARFEAHLRDAYNEILIKDLESEVKFLKEFNENIKKDLDKNQ
tara:strand:- start:259 stop:522 length:264 start_codon:yes stop_codon:yes gene_type:complete